jgi:hypothetical protein
MASFYLKLTGALRCPLLMHCFPTMLEFKNLRRSQLRRSSLLKAERKQLAEQPAQPPTNGRAKSSVAKWSGLEGGPQPRVLASSLPESTRTALDGFLRSSRPSTALFPPRQQYPPPTSSEDCALQSRIPPDRCVVIFSCKRSPHPMRCVRQLPVFRVLSIF